MRFIISLIILCTTLSLCHAQQAVYVPAGGKVWNFGNVAVFGDMTNNGLLGSSPSSVFQFFGKQWTNGYNATMNDESPGGRTGKGGTFRFSGNGQQTIAGGFNIAANMGCSFPNVDVNNPGGILLQDLNDLKVRNNLNFSTGHVFLNGWNLVVGDTAPGTITNYSDQRYVVTGTGTSGGFLYRLKVQASSNQIVFPVGATATDYSPAGILYEGTGEDFHVRVFDSVYQNAITGPVLYDSVVYKTWNIGQDGSSQVALTLQHNNADEALEYQVNRDNSYISRYEFLPGHWESRTGVNDNMAAGTLSTQPLQNATQHSRGFEGGLGINSYFTKLTPYSLSYLPADIVLFNAIRVSDSRVDITWNTIRETDNAVFEIERMFDNDSTWTTVATVPTQAPNGNSTTTLKYYDPDANSYDGWTYYRIKVISKTGKYIYTDVREVPPLIEVVVYPNPNLGDFKVNIKGIKAPLMMTLYDTWGQLIREKEIVQAGEVEFKDMPAGTYVFILKYKDTQKLAYTCKVIVIAH